MKKLVFKLLLVLILIPVVYFLIIIIYGSATNYNPDDKVYLSNMEESILMDDTSEYSLLIWNIGYAGLGAEMDFFYDGGNSVRAAEDNVRRNMYEINQFLQRNDTIDFIMLQEVDTNSKRSYKIDEFNELNLSMPSHFMFYALNYKAGFVPLPFFRPMGRVNSGLVNMTIPVPKETVRLSLPGDYSWPKSIFMLDRCLLVSRYELMNNKEFVLINVHNSAYDDGTLKEKETGFIRDFIQEEYKKGNYIALGGDWNQCPPDFKPEIQGYLFDTINFSKIDSDFISEDWTWSYDSKAPSNRRVDIPYNKEKTMITLIDFFLTSPNIKVLSCKTISENFKYSDHNPVLLRFKFKK